MTTAHKTAEITAPTVSPINSTRLIRVALLAVMFLPMIAGAFASTVFIGAKAGWDGAAEIVAHLFDEWS